MIYYITICSGPLADENSASCCSRAISNHSAVGQKPGKITNELLCCSVITSPEAMKKFKFNKDDEVRLSVTRSGSYNMSAVFDINDVTMVAKIYDSLKDTGVTISPKVVYV